MLGKEFTLLAMKFAFLTISILNFLSYFWSVIGIFKKVEEQSTLNYRLLQINSLALWGALPIAIVKSELSSAVYFLGVGIQMFCLVSFWAHSKIVRNHNFSIVFSKDLPTKLIREGFYKKIRHPFYTIYTITYFSIAIITQDLVSLLLSATMFAIYVKAAKFEEKKFKNSTLNMEYDEYKKVSGMFYPRLR